MESLWTDLQRIREMAATTEDPRLETLIKMTVDVMAKFMMEEIQSRTALEIKLTQALHELRDEIRELKNRLPPQESGD